MLSGIIVRLRALLFRRRHDDELDEELRYHFDREVDRYTAAGLSPGAARAAARRVFGNPTVATENARDETRWRPIEELHQDTAHAIRAFRRAPVFVLTVIGTIGLGLGLLASVFTFFNAYVLRPLAVRDPHTLYEVSWAARNGGKHRFTWDQLQRSVTATPALAESFGVMVQQTRLLGRPAVGQLVTGNYFQMLAVPPAIGRTILPSDTEEPGRNAVIVLSHHAWTTIFVSDSGVIGRRVNISGASVTIVGVAREGFGGLSSVPFDYWMPITMTTVIGPVPTLFEPGVEGVHIIGRLAPGVNTDRAASLLTTWVRAETADRPSLERATGVTLTPRGTSMPTTADSMSVFAPVVVAFLLITLIACANVANIMLARGMARQREMGIRLALGASRGRVIRQLLVEALLLAAPAGVAGFFLSRAVIWTSLHVMFATVPTAYLGYIRVVPLDADLRVAGFMLLAAAAAAIAFGLAPALQATRPNIVQASRGDFDTQLRPSRVRNAHVVAQITLSVVLVVCAGVLLSGARRSATLDPGIRTADVIQIELQPDFFTRALDALRTDPGVVGIAGSSSTPLDGLFSTIAVSLDGRPAERASYIIVSPEYFPALGLPIISGRPFTEDEGRNHAAVAIVSQSTARQLWPNRDPVGATLSIPPTTHDYSRLERYHSVRVIGVTRDAVPGGIVASPHTPMVYYPQTLMDNPRRVLVRVSGDADEARARFERSLAAIDSGAVMEMHTLDAALAVQVYPFRAMYWVASALGVIALILTLIGVYGVISYLVAQRHKEFGIRLALGAAGSSLVALVLRQSMRLSLLGVLIGVATALGVSRLLASALYNIDTFDVVGYSIGVVVVLVACLFAAYIPSRRAASVDPVDALRSDSN